MLLVLYVSWWWWWWNIISKLSDAFPLSPVVRVATGLGSALSLLPVHPQT